MRNVAAAESTKQPARIERDPVAPSIGSRGRRPRAVSPPDLDVIADQAPWIPPGQYEAVGGTAKKFTMLRGAIKIRVEWRVLVPDPTQPDGVRHVMLPRFYNVHAVPGGRFRAGSSSHYTRDWALVAGRQSSRADRSPPNVFEGVLCLVEVRTVDHDANQRALPAAAHYSRIAQLIEVRAGGRRA